MLANLLLMSYVMIEPNYDEDKVPSYSLTDPLTFADGRAVTQASDWLDRRAEILQLFETEVYGQTPDKRLPMDVETFGENPNALDGTAIQEQVILRFGASSLANDILMQITKQQSGAYQSADYFSKD